MKPIIDPWANLAVFEKETDARELEATLRSRGFEARTHNDRGWQLLWFFAPPRATFRVQVGAKDAAAVHQYVASESAAAFLAQRALHCPSCGSLKVQYPQMTRRFIMPTILMDFGILFRLVEHQAYCEECHYTWPLQKGAPQPTRELVSGNQVTK
jgi:DNA-directed RNA polymerase subunit M/transcription elongation factor TFIIS